MFHLVSCIPQSDMNGHFGSSIVGCDHDGMPGGFGCGDRNADGSRSLEFAVRLNLIICSTLFMKQESQLSVTAYLCWLCFTCIV